MSCKYLMVIEFTESLGPFEQEMIAMFNEKYISEEAVRDYIKSYGSNIGYNKLITFMTKEQYINLKDPTDTDFLEELRLEQQGGIY